MISIAINNGSDNTVGRSYYSVNQAVGKFTELVNGVHRKCQTRAGVSGDVNKMLECVTITDSKLSNRLEGGPISHRKRRQIK